MGFRKHGFITLETFGILQVDSVPVLTGATEIIDSVAITEYRSVKWLVSIEDTITNKYFYFEIAATHNNISAQHWCSGLLFDKLDVVDDVDISGGVMRLLMTNNHSEDISIRVLRLGTLI
jgi:hypothetical protein